MAVNIKRISVLQTGKFLALIYGMLGLIYIPFLLFGSIVGVDAGMHIAELLFLVILYPIIGFVSGVIFAALYKLVANYIGGIEMTLESEYLSTSLDTVRSQST